MVIPANESKLHYSLKVLSMIKLLRQGYLMTAHEVGTHYAFGHFDTVGYRAKYYGQESKSIGIEVKVSRVDYFGKKQRRIAYYTSGKVSSSFRLENGINEMYFLVPKGLIKHFELYPGWGLMEWDGKSIKKVIPAPFLRVNTEPAVVGVAEAMRNDYHKRLGVLSEHYEICNYCDIVKELGL